MTRKRSILAFLFILILAAACTQSSDKEALKEAIRAHQSGEAADGASTQDGR